MNTLDTANIGVEGQSTARVGSTQSVTPVPSVTPAATESQARTLTPTRSSTPTIRPTATASPTVDAEAEAELHAQRASEFYDSENYAAAGQEAEFAFALNPQQEGALFVLGLLALLDNQFDKAESYFDNVISLVPDMQAAYYQRALARQGLDRAESALEDTSRCQDLATEAAITTACAQLEQQLTESLATATPSPAPTATLDPAADLGYTCEQCIKGNINAEGERIYHYPGCGSYAQTKIDTAQGERWFSSEAEAVAAGWRKAKNCP